MAGYHKHALAIADALTGLDGVEVLPNPPQSPMMHLQLRLSIEELQRKVVEVARTDRIWTFPRPFSTISPTLLRVEFSIGDATMGFSPTEVRSLIERLVNP